MSKTKYAIRYVLGAENRVLVVDATDRDHAYEVARDQLYRRFASASIQGTACAASQDDIDRAEAQYARDRGEALS